jgi:hypothetical protein
VYFCSIQFHFIQLFRPIGILHEPEAESTGAQSFAGHCYLQLFVCRVGVHEGQTGQPVQPKHVTRYFCHCRRQLEVATSVINYNYYSTRTTTMVSSSPFQCLTLSLLIIPPLLLTTYFLAAFPNPPEPTFLHTSLASLPATSKSWSIYPENYYPGGGYATFPYGRVCTAHGLADRVLTRSRRSDTG